MTHFLVIIRDVISSVFVLLVINLPIIGCPSHISSLTEAYAIMDIAQNKMISEISDSPNLSFIWASRDFFLVLDVFFDM